MIVSRHSGLTQGCGEVGSGAVSPRLKSVTEFEP
jgi:hypothetical protein